MKYLWQGSLLLLAPLLLAQQKATAPAQLITPDDISYWDEAEKHLTTRGESSAPPVLAPDSPLKVETIEDSGPEIQVLAPKTASVDSPFDLQVRFVAHAAGVDAASIHVLAKKWILNDFRFARDISERVRPYSSTEGIHVPQADMPSGTFQFVLRVSDTAQKGSAVRLVLAVKPRK